MSLISYFLATNQDVQEQLHREVSDAIAQNGGDQHLDYNAIQSRPYLDQVSQCYKHFNPLTVLHLDNRLNMFYFYSGCE